VPLVALDSYSANPRTIGVRTDDRKGGWLAGARLTEAGHRRILFAGPPYEGMGVVGQRWEGFRSACIAAGVEASDITQASAFTTFEDGRELGLRLRHDHPEVTGVFATADVLAIGIMAGIREAGGSVPRDLSVIGFDDLDLSAYISPGLTTIAQDMPAKVAEASRIILDEIELGEGPRVPVSLGVKLVERRSVAMPRPAG
jgi:LacI family transcriptional regulator